MDKIHRALIGSVSGATIGLAFPLAIGCTIGQEETVFCSIAFAIAGGGVGALGKKMALIFILLLFVHLGLVFCWLVTWPLF